MFYYTVYLFHVDLDDYLERKALCLNLRSLHERKVCCKAYFASAGPINPLRENTQLLFAVIHFGPI